MWHLGVLSKLVNLNIPIQLTNLIIPFLENRSFCVHGENSILHAHWIFARVPQRSYLSLLIFNLYINDIPSSSTIKINLFSDDTIYFCSSISKHSCNQAKYLGVRFDAELKFSKHINTTKNAASELLYTLYHLKKDHYQREPKSQSSSVHYLNPNLRGSYPHHRPPMEKTKRSPKHLLTNHSEYPVVRKEHSHPLKHWHQRY